MASAVSENKDKPDCRDAMPDALLTVRKRTKDKNKRIILSLKTIYKYFIY